MEYPIQLIKVVDIYLDNQNPRHDPIDAQKEIIEHLLIDELVYNLAKDISQLGTSPLDMIAVTRNANGHYIALEGNRRVCALKLLNDPELAPSSKIKAFKSLQKEARQSPEEVMAVIFSDRDSADPWLDRRHLGLQDGIGTKDWTSDQRTRRNTGRTKKNKDDNALSQALLDYAQKSGILGEYPKKVLTTGTRYLGNPEFRKGAGIVSARTDPVVEINVAHDDFEVFLKRFCHDLIEGQKVHSRSKKPEWLAYLEELKQDGVLGKENVSDRLLGEKEKYHANEAKNGTKQDKKQKEDSEKIKGRSSKNPDTRKYILPPEFKVKTQNKQMTRTAVEMRSILVEDKPLSVALLTRAFLEATYCLFIENITGSYPDGLQTHVVIERVCNNLESEKSQLTKEQRNALAGLRKLGSNQHSPLSPQTLGAYAHAASYPDHKTLKREFDNIAAIIEYMLPRT